MSVEERILGDGGNEANIKLVTDTCNGDGRKTVLPVFILQGTYG